MTDVNSTASLTVFVPANKIFVYNAKTHMSIDILLSWHAYYIYFSCTSQDSKIVKESDFFLGFQVCEPREDAFQNPCLRKNIKIYWML